jgi:hypothetical protein
MPDSIKSAVAVLECDIATAKAQDTLFAFIKIDDLQLVLEALTTMQAREATLIREREWQPIETAPKDGTEVLIFDANAKKGYVGDTPNVAYWDDSREAGWWGSYETEQTRPHTPTHWMPLPSVEALGTSGLVP